MSYDYDDYIDDDALTFDWYQEAAQSFDLTRGTPDHRLHALFQFLEEAGEVAGVVKRLYRGDYADKETNEIDAIKYRAKLRDELGDALWGLAAIADSHGLSLQDIAETNIAKLEARKAKGVIKGSGER